MTDSVRLRTEDSSSHEQAPPSAPVQGEGSSFHQKLLRQLLAGATERFDIRLWNGDVVSIGQGGAPLFTLVVKDARALAALDEDSVGESYIQGWWDIEGDARAAFGLRRHLEARTPPLGLLGLIGRIFLVDPTRNNSEAITAHYQLGDDFYLSFLDKRYRIYSHGHFRHAEESLEEAQEHKLQDMYDSLGLQPGMRLLDIGGGWGPVPQFCGERGVRVTSVTLAPDSHAYITRLIQERNLPCEVVHADFLRYEPPEPFDAIVIYGVIEHIPQYRRFVEKVWRVLKPGGKMYLDASATRTKYDMSWMTKKYVWPTTTAYLSLHDLTAEFNYAGFELLEVKNESKDYELTMLHWSQRFEAARDFIVQRWGEQLYRIFRLYLWSGYTCFVQDRLQAYRMVVRRREEPGPRPGLLRRALLSAWGAY